MPVEITRADMFAVGIKPVTECGIRASLGWNSCRIRGAAPSGGKIRVGPVHTKVHVGDHNALADVAQSPEIRGPD